MSAQKIRITIQDMTWERCVSRVESTLKSFNGVLDVKAELVDENQGKAEIIYNPTKVSVEDLMGVIPSASGENHKFIVISATENSPE